MKVIPTSPRAISFSGNSSTEQKPRKFLSKKPKTPQEIIMENVNKQLRPKTFWEGIKQMFTIDWRSIKYK